MKHLKKFNENISDKLEELKDFCENSLAYLLDDKIIIDYIYRNSVTYKSYFNGQELNDKKPIYLVNIFSYDLNNDIEWNEIKDYFIPFLERLSSNYKLYGWTNDIDYVNIGYKKYDGNITGLNMTQLSFYDVINDNMDIDKIYSITLKVEI